MTTRRSRSTVRFTPRLDEDLLAIVDRHRGTLTRAGALRISLLLLVERMEKGQPLEVGAPVAPQRRQFAFELDGDLYARAKSLVAAGRAPSIAELVRAAGVELGKGGRRG